MPVSSIAQILLRLFALNWFLTGLIQLVSTFFIASQGAYYFYTIAPALIYIVASVVFWFVAPFLSRQLSKRNEGEFSLTGVTERQLYSTALLALGVYFSLSSFASVFSWIHFFTINKSPDYGFHQGNEPSYYSLTEGVMTLIAGITLIFQSRSLAARLTANNSEQADAGNRAKPGA